MGTPHTFLPMLLSKFRLLLELKARKRDTPIYNRNSQDLDSIEVTMNWWVGNETMAYKHNGILFIHKPGIWGHGSGTGGYRVKQAKPRAGRQVLQVLMHLWKLKKKKKIDSLKRRKSRKRREKRVWWRARQWYHNRMDRTNAVLFSVAKESAIFQNN